VKRERESMVSRQLHGVSERERERTEKLNPWRLR
jgi:hypothetical protein